MDFSLKNIFKKGILISALQVLGFVVSGLGTLFIAASIEPDSFAIIGKFLLIVSIISSLSISGYETLIGREALKWIRLKQRARLSAFISRAYVVRFFRSIFISLGFIVYHILAPSDNWYLIGAVVCGIFSSLSNLNSIVLRSTGSFVLSHLVNILANSVLKIIAIIFFVYFGLDTYLIVLVLLPLLTFSISIFLIGPYLVLTAPKTTKFLRFDKLHFLGSAYTRYAILNIDRILAALLLSSEVFATYALARQLQFMGKKLIEGMCDPVTQRIVHFKGNVARVKIELLKNIKFFILLSLCAAFVAILVFWGPLPIVLNAYYSDYEYIEVYIFFVTMISVIYIISKPFVDFWSFFGHPKVIFAIDIIVLIFSLVVYSLLFWWAPQQFIYIGGVLVFTFLLIVSFWRTVVIFND